MKQQIAITGLHGEIASTLKQELSKLSDAIIDLNHANFDLLQPEKFEDVLNQYNPSVVIHLAGLTHIDRCEADKENGKSGLVWKTNVTATQELAHICAMKNIHLIYLSTECVFDGKKEEFFENDQTSPINWYGVTKEAAEKEIITAGGPATILRAVIGYSSNAKNTLWQKIAKKLSEGSEILMANDHWMTPTYLPDIARSIEVCIEKKLNGIYHVAPKKQISPYDFANKVAGAIGYSNQLIKPAPLTEIIGKEKADLRLVHANLNSQMTEHIFGFEFTNPDAAIKKL